MIRNTYCSMMLMSFGNNNSEYHVRCQKITSNYIDYTLKMVRGGRIVWQRKNKIEVIEVSSSAKMQTIVK